MLDVPNSQTQKAWEFEHVYAPRVVSNFGHSRMIKTLNHRALSYECFRPTLCSTLRTLSWTSIIFTIAYIDISLSLVVEKANYHFRYMSCESAAEQDAFCDPQQDDDQYQCARIPGGNLLGPNARAPRELGGT